MPLARLAVCAQLFTQITAYRPLARFRCATTVQRPRLVHVMANVRMGIAALQARCASTTLNSRLPTSSEDAASNCTTSWGTRIRLAVQQRQMGMFAGVAGEVAGLWANPGGRLRPIASSSESFVVDNHGLHPLLLNAIAGGGHAVCHGNASPVGAAPALLMTTVARLAASEPTSLLIGLLVSAQQAASVIQCLTAQLAHCIC